MDVEGKEECDEARGDAEASEVVQVASSSFGWPFEASWSAEEVEKVRAEGALCDDRLADGRAVS